MAYDIQFGQPFGLPFSAQFLLVDHDTGAPVSIGDNAFEFHVAHREGAWPWLRATQANGLVTVGDPGKIGVAIPPGLIPFGFCGPDYGCWAPAPRSAHFRLLAIPYDPVFTTLLAAGTISFGDA